MIYASPADGAFAVNRCPSRRRFIRLVVLGAAAAPLASVAQRACAAELPHLDEADSLASALGYHHDATKIDAAKYPAWKPDQTCANCKQALAPQADGWLPCALFPNKAVDPKGWCGAWIAKA